MPERLCRGKAAGVELSRVVWAVSHVSRAETDLPCGARTLLRGNRKDGLLLLLPLLLFARHKRPETFELPRTYRACTCFFGAFGTTRRRPRRSSRRHMCVTLARLCTDDGNDDEDECSCGANCEDVCVRRERERGFPARASFLRSAAPMLSSRTIVKPPLSGHINTSTSALPPIKPRIYGELIRSPSPVLAR